MAQLPSEKVKTIRKFKIKLANLIGMENSNGEKFSIRLILIVLFFLLEQIMHFNGLYRNRKNIVNICNSMALFSVALQLAARLIRHIIRDDNQIVENLYTFIMKFYYREETTVNDRPVLMKNLNQSEKILRIFLFVTILTYLTPATTAWILPFFTHEFKLFAPVYLPHTEPNETFGFILNMMIMTLVSCTVTAIFMAGDAYIVFCSLQVVPMADIFVIKLDNFAKKLNNFRNETNLAQPSTSKTSEEINAKFTEKEIKMIQFNAEFIDLLKEFHDYNDYVRHLIVYAEFTFFMAIFFNSFGIGLSVIVMKFYSTPIGISYIYFMTQQVAMPCIIGTMISTQNTKILNELSSFPYYEMSIKSQKIFLQFLLECQNANSFNLPIFGILNMELFTDVIHGAYSYLMYVLNFVKI
ncbi:hypothetical protein PVAND_006311 [Polypedilum vanderplanki]|uniref:Odorant receptor n=1 Tax=Polypedilum vanderplanki TaxID=319348 RepID=A0A9J6C3P1_POLVA|nr:hypothetical protein PVAND_006311 [Polypedilum vanderplanki]